MDGKLNQFAPTKHARPMVIATVAAMALIVSGCATTGNQTNNTNVFADLSVDEILQAGNAAFDAGEMERAVFLYMQALEVEQSAETWYRIGLGKSRLGDKAYAWKALNKAVEIDPKHAASHEELGLTYLALGQPEQAEQHLAIATELEPERWAKRMASP